MGTCRQRRTRRDSFERRDCLFVSLWVCYGMHASQESLQKAFHVAIRQLQELQVRGRLHDCVDSSSSRDSVGLFESEVGVRRVWWCSPSGPFHLILYDYWMHYYRLSVDMGGTDVVVVVDNCLNSALCVGAIYEWDCVAS